MNKIIINILHFYKAIFINMFHTYPNYNIFMFFVFQLKSQINCCLVSKENDDKN